MNSITSDQIMAAIRQLLLVAGGVAVTRGWVSQDDLQIIVPAGLTLAVAIWGLWVRRPHGIIKSAAALPQVDAVVTKPKTASEIPVANVVGSVTEAGRLPGVTH